MLQVSYGAALKPHCPIHLSLSFPSPFKLLHLRPTSIAFQRERKRERGQSEGEGESRVVKGASE